MEQQEYLDNYEKQLTEQLLRSLTSRQLQAGQLLATDDITERWESLAAEYIPDAVKEIAKYPTVALGWAMYLGMAVANYWDTDWEVYGQVENLYLHLRDKRGFDYLDEVVRGEVLLLTGEAYDKAERVVQDCAQQVLARIRHEQVEPQSPLAFHVYVRSIKTLFLVGASLELFRLGYKFERVQ